MPFIKRCPLQGGWNLKIYFNVNLSQLNNIICIIILNNHKLISYNEYQLNYL